MRHVHKAVLRANSRAKVAPKEEGKVQAATRAPRITRPYATCASPSDAIIPLNAAATTLVAFVIPALDVRFV